MSTTDDYDSSQESTLRPIDSTIMKSQWDQVDSNDGQRRSKNSRDWVSDDEYEEDASIDSTIRDRTMYDEAQQLSKIRTYVSSVTRRDKIRMDHEIKATSPTRVPNDRMGAYLYGCSSREVMTGDVDRGCMLSCLHGYRPEDIDSCNHDVYRLDGSVLTEVYKAPIKSKSEVAYIFTESSDSAAVKKTLSKLKGTPVHYKVFTTNASGSAADFLFEVIPFNDIKSLIDNPRDVVIMNPDLDEENPPPPSTGYAMFWTWLLIIIVVILLILGIIWLVSYFMRQQAKTSVVSPVSSDVLVTETTTVVTTSESDLWSSSPISGPRKPYLY